MFSLELALLRASKTFDRLKRQLLEIVSALEEQAAIPAIGAQQALILEIQTDPWWEGVTVPLLELVRIRLRNLVQHIDKKRKAIVYTDFEDEMGTGSGVELPQAGEVDFARFRKNARNFLREHEDHITLQKLRRGRPLTSTDLGQLEDMLLAAGVGDAEQIGKAAELSQGLGRFIRSLVGLDRGAAAEAFSEFLVGGAATSEQIEFIDMVVEHLTHKGIMDPGLLYESPFTDIALSGPEQVFDLKRAGRLVEVIEGIGVTSATHLVGRRAGRTADKMNRSSEFRLLALAAITCKTLCHLDRSREQTCSGSCQTLRVDRGQRSMPEDETT